MPTESTRRPPKCRSKLEKPGTFKALLREVQELRRRVRALMREADFLREMHLDQVNAQAEAVRLAEAKLATCNKANTLLSQELAKLRRGRR